MKKNKRCISSSFLTKADADICQYAFDQQFHFVVNCSKEKKRVVFLYTMYTTKSLDTVTGKEEVNVFYKHEKAVLTAMIK